jgi:hypothetical protein
MKFIKNLFRSGKRRTTGHASQTRTDLHQRLQELYGHEKMELQLLYERWVARESWLLRSEALPLLYGYDPATSGGLADVDLRNHLAETWAHARECVRQGLLKVENQEKDPDHWRCSPVDVYRWAVISRIPMPERLTELMSFVTRVISQPAAPDGSVDRSGDKTGNSPETDRELVLGMGLALLAAYPDLARKWLNTLPSS